MRTWQRLFVSALVALFCATAGAQEEPTATALGPVEPVMDRIPAGTMGFVILPQLGKAAKGTDDFIAAIGLGEQASQMMPGGLLEAIKLNAGFGPGLNPNGAIAVAMLDPQVFGVDLMQIMMPSPATAATMPQEEPKLPLVIYLPGTGIPEVMGNWPTEPAGEFTTVMLPPGPMLAAQCGDYVIISPSEDALRMVLSAEQSASQELAGRQGDLISGSDIAIYVNMKVAGPVLDKVLEQMQQMMQAMTQMASPANPSVSPASIIGFYREMLSQLDGFTVAGRYVPTGLLVEQFVQYTPGSDLAAAVAAYEPSDGPLLNRLPNLPYVLAAGSSGVAPGTAMSEFVSLYADLLETASQGRLSGETKAKFVDIVSQLIQQVNSCQFVGGGAPADSGVFAVATVLDCEDSAVVKSLLAETADVFAGIVRAMVDDPQAQQLELKYTAQAEIVGDIEVDAIEVLHPKLAEASEEEKADMLKVMGEQQVRVLIAAPDANTVVVTLGGSTLAMQEALAAAAGTGSIPAAPGVEQALQYMPEKPVFTMLFSGQNLYEVIRTGAAIMGKPDEVPDFTFTSVTPIAIGSAVEDASAYSSMYVPSDLIKDVVSLIKQTQAQQEQMYRQQPAPVMPDEDF